MRPHGNPKDLEKRRFRAIALLKSGKTYREISRIVKSSLSSVVRWAQMYRKKKRKGLKSQATWGQPCKLSSKQKEDLVVRLVKGAMQEGYSTELWTLERIARLIRKYYHVQYTGVGVWKLLRNVLGWSCQKPERRALERDEKAIADWKKRTWPHIKKSQKTWCPSGLSGRKRVSAYS